MCIRDRDEEDRKEDIANLVNHDLPKGMFELLSDDTMPVSYTHLDVYKRQVIDCATSPSFMPLARKKISFCTCLVAGS